jgi:hypothetical protein
MRWHSVLISTFLLGMATLAAADCTKNYVNLPGWPPKTLICQTCCYSDVCKTTCW